MNSYEHWLSIADDISALITKIEHKDRVRDRSAKLHRDRRPAWSFQDKQEAVRGTRCSTKSNTEGRNGVAKSLRL